MSRRLGFLAAIVVGLALGLLYGWVVNPVKYVDTAPDTLRVDYRTDIVLMTAEIYRADGDLAQATRRLALLGSQPPAQMARDAQADARANGFSEADQALIENLALALAGPAPVPARPTPRGTP